MSKKVAVCYKYIYQDNQQTCFQEFCITDRYYSSRKAFEKDYKIRLKEHQVKLVGPWRISKQTGEMAWKLTEHERV